MSTYEEVKKIFWAKYQALFGSIPFKESEEEVAREWGKFIRRISLRQVDDLFEQVSLSRGRRHFRPMLEEFSRAWEMVTSGESHEHILPDCRVCFRQGALPVLAYREGGKWIRGYRQDARIAFVPCGCTAGKKREPNAAQSRIDASMDWLTSQTQGREFSGMGALCGYLEDCLKAWKRDQEPEPQAELPDQSEDDGDVTIDAVLADPDPEIDDDIPF